MSEEWSYSSKHPGIVVFLIDTSGSMSEDLEEGLPKIDVVSGILSKFLRETVDKCNSFDHIKEKTYIKNRVYTAAIEYSGREDGSDPVRSIWARYGVNKIALSTEELDDLLKHTNGMVKIDANGNTPMAQAFLKAKEIVEDWLDNYGNESTPPPIILNITDGEFNDLDDFDKFVETANKIKEIQTPWGPPLVYNIQLSTKSGKYVLKYPEELPDEVSGDDYIRAMFTISSIMPEYSLKELRELYREEIVSGAMTIGDNARGFLLNATYGNVLQFVRIGSLVNNRR